MLRGKAESGGEGVVGLALNTRLCATLNMRWKRALVLGVGAS